MKLREITREVIQRLEEKSGYQVHVMEDPNLSTIAAIRIARDNVPAHILSVRPAPGASPDYAICWQCVFAMRMFECPEGERFQIAASQLGNEAVERLLNAPGGIVRKLRLNGVQVGSLKQQLLGGLVTHLRSVPIGLRVVSWLGRTYPQLHEEERSLAEQELKMGRDSLAPRIKQMMPPEIFAPTAYINTAHAIFWAERLGEPKLVNPYRAQGYEPHGKKLLEIASQILDEPSQDKELIDSWATQLKIKDWYTWLPYLAP